MCERAIENNPWRLKYVPDLLKTEKMRIKAVEKEAEAIENVSGALRPEKCALKPSKKKQKA